LGVAKEIEKTFRAISDRPGKMKLATAGCPRNCSEALIKDRGAVAVGDNRWEIVVGGAGGSHVRKGDLLCTVEGEDAVMLIAGRFMQFYREDAKYKERTYTWVERMGMTPAQVVAEYPHLTMAQVHAALAYYWSHQDEIHQDIANEEKLVAELVSLTLALHRRRRFHKRTALSGARHQRRFGGNFEY